MGNRRTCPECYTSDVKWVGGKDGHYECKECGFKWGEVRRKGSKYD